jgi:hypothetical protein
MLVSLTFFYQHFLNIAIFFKNVGQHFSPGFFQHFSEMLQHFLKKVGFVNYFLSTFCEMLQHFSENLKK